MSKSGLQWKDGTDVILLNRVQGRRETPPLSLFSNEGVGITIGYRNREGSLLAVWSWYHRHIQEGEYIKLTEDSNVMQRYKSPSSSEQTSRIVTCHPNH